ncbi:MAG: hypothetical protein COB02_11765 [Candidatus Cloacimonadota bacterium]|nr:MAG: hypothetical protein COB02_11765 [Candidatus Cloacimonadota bacterium]
MSFSYPLSHPLIPIKKHSYKLRQVQAISQSPYTLSTQVHTYTGQSLEYSLQYRTMKQLEARKLIGFLLRMNGIVGSVYLGDPDGNLGNHDGSNLTIVSKTSPKEIICSGFLPLQQQALIEGDFFSFSNYELKRVCEDVNVDGSGSAIIKFESALRDQTINTGSIITTNNPKGIFRLATPNIEYSSDELKEHEMTLIFVEKIL